VDGISAELKDFMEMMSNMTKMPLSNYSIDWKPLPQNMTTIEPTPLVSSPPEGMLKIPGGNSTFIVAGNEIEGNNPGVDVQYPMGELSSTIPQAHLRNRVVFH